MGMSLLEVMPVVLLLNCLIHILVREVFQYQWEIVRIKQELSQIFEFQNICEVLSLRPKWQL